MTARARTVYVGLDSCDLEIAQGFASRGAMPNLAALLEKSAVQETFGPLGYLVGGNWATLYTGVSPPRHQFICSGQVRGGTYEPRWVGPVTYPAVWNHVSDAGGRVAVLDAPHAAVATSLNGVQLVEWGAHDRHAGTKSYPREFLEQVNARYGPHPLGTRTAPFPHHAPCDMSHRAAVHRTTAENRVLLDEILEGANRKAALTCDLLDKGGWDLFFTVFGESHCGGHQFWKHHDPDHPLHDPDETAALGGDPLRTIYQSLDQHLGEVLDHVDEATTVYVHMSHRMRAHYDGTCLLEPVLWKLDQYAAGRSNVGAFSRAADAALNVVPRSRRRRAIASLLDARRKFIARAGPIGTDGKEVDVPEWIGARRWWPNPNDSVFGSIRLNLEGREPNGRVVGPHKRAVEAWLAERLLELVNVDTGSAAVADVYFTDDHYDRVDGDPLGDLIVEWNRTEPLSTVWSPATGVVTAPYVEWRTGDHDRGGLLLVRGPGVRPGRRGGSISVMDVGPTLAASVGVEMPDADGVPRADLLPSSATRVRPSNALPRPMLSDAPGRIEGRRQYRAALDVPLDRWNEQYALGLASALHAVHLQGTDNRRELTRLEGRLGDVARLARITEVQAWLRHVDVPETQLISVVMPTHNRAELVGRAIDSVLGQSYPNWELLVVDDASTDETWPLLEKYAAIDPRIRVFRFETNQLSSIARNHALENATGHLITYLDDDNRFDPDWLRAVAWAFGEYPETKVAYGARVVDDDVRHRGYDGRSLPFVQFLRWDRDAMMQSNRVDQNVIAHRASAVRLDEEIDHFTDWDLMLQLTTECEPLELPALAVHYYSDAAERASDRFRARNDEESLAAHVREREWRRRGTA